MADDDLSPQLHNAVRSLAGARGPCPVAGTLVEYEALDQAGRARAPIHAHVQVCSRCQLVLLRLDEAHEQPRTARHRWLLPLAAGIAIAAMGPVIYRTVTSPAAVIESVRGTELQPTAPVGRVERVAAFEWQSPMRASRYRVTVYRGAGIAWTGESIDTRLPMPASAALETGEYVWQVDALDREGVVRMSSPRTAFSVAR